MSTVFYLPHDMQGESCDRCGQLAVVRSELGIYVLAWCLLHASAHRSALLRWGAQFVGSPLVVAYMRSTEAA